MKPHTGWKACPKPMSAEKASIMILPTMEKAAMAASASAEATEAPAAALRQSAATLARPWRQSEGTPPMTMFFR